LWFKLKRSTLVPLAGGPVEIIPTLFREGFSDICLRITSAPGKLASARRLLPAGEAKYFKCVNVAMNTLLLLYLHVVS
jgi:hypothetical protein